MTSRMSSRAATAGVLAALCMASGAHAAVTISSAATSNMSCVSGICTPTAANAVLNVGDLENLLASGNVEVTTTGSGVQASDIQIAAPFSWSSAGALSLDAFASIAVTAQVSVAGSGGLSLTTNDGGTNGTLTFLSGGNFAFAAPANALVINGERYRLETTIRQLAYDVVAHPDHAFALAKDIDAKRHIFRTSPIPVNFTGALNGLGHVISGLEIADSADQLGVGMFATLSARGSISGVGLENVRVIGGIAAGGIVGNTAGGTITNSWVSGIVQAEYAGGLIGASGGLIGVDGTSVSDSWSSANVEGQSAGGLVGLNDGTIVTSFATGAVAGIGGGGSGALAGVSFGPIMDSYATGNVKDTPVYSVGGLVGYAGGGAVSSSYSAGRVKAGHPAGGFIGNNFGATAASCYWDTSNNEGLSGVGSGSGAGITGETTAQLQAGLPSGFDPTIWAESPSINNGLPYLINNPPQ